MMKKLPLVACFLALFSLGIFAADFVTQIKGSAYIATDRVGFQTWNYVRLNFDAINAFIKTGTGTPEATVVATVGAVYRQTDGADGTTLWQKTTGAGNTGWASTPTASSADTLTNKTLDAEGTGNLLSLSEKLWLPSALCQNATPVSAWSTPASSPAVFACNAGSNVIKGTAEFADSANLSMQTAAWLPADFTGTVDARFRWFTPATSGNVVWQLATICIADAETSDPAYNAASTVTDAAKGTTLQDNDATITAVTITGCAAGEMMYVKVFRDSAHASDTLASTASLRGLELTIRRAI